VARAALGYAGLVLVLDVAETLQRVRGDVREKGLNQAKSSLEAERKRPAEARVPARLSLHHRESAQP
jgi:hypothetical protein